MAAGLTEDQAREWIESGAHRLEQGANLRLAIVDNGTGEFLGQVGVGALDWEQEVGEIYYWLAPEARGRGIATRSVRLLSAWAFDALGLERLVLYTHTDNPASQAVARRAGFQREGVLRSHQWFKGTRIDSVAFARLRAPTRLREIRMAEAADLPFIVEMARSACVIEDRPKPEPDDEEVTEMLPADASHAVVASDGPDQRLGAAWWHFHEPALLGEGREDIPELVVAVTDEVRNRGIGTALIEALAERAGDRYELISLNVHLRNPATRLYTTTGFQVAGAGRGSYGVAMTRDLRAD